MIRYALPVNSVSRVYMTIRLATFVLLKSIYNSLTGEILYNYIS